MSSNEPKTIALKINLLHRDGGTQKRSLCQATIDEYAEQMKAGAKFPAVKAIRDGEKYWLWDGHHRIDAAVAAGLESLECDVTEGTIRDAIWLSFGANKEHGLRREPGAKKAIILEILNDPEWAKIPLIKIAEHVGTSQGYVSDVRKTTAHHIASDKIATTRNGKTYNMNVGNIGHKKPSRPDPIDDMDFAKTDDAHAAPVKDQLGNVLEQKKAIDAFARISVGQDILHRLSMIKAEVAALIKSNDPLATHLSDANFIANISSAYAFAKELIPYVLCPYCAARNPRCKACKGAGFITKFLYDNTVPEEMKDEELKV